MKTIIMLLSVLLVSCAPPSEEGPGNEPATQVIHVSSVPDVLFKRAMAYFELNRASIPNQNYVTIVDFSLPSKTARMYLIDMRTHEVEVLHVAHGVGSDPKGTGMATKFSNTPNSYMSSLGFYLTSNETYGASVSGGVHLIIDGLEASNSKARPRGIQVHGAKYVYSKDVKPGMSEGCFAVPWEVRDRVVKQIRGGSLILAGQS